MGNIIVSYLKVSLILPSFKRANLLDLTLTSILKYGCNYDLEVVVINDGIEDETETVCNKYKPCFDIKYIFSGKRNVDEIKPRIPGFAINIGVRYCSGDIIILSCPEVYHITDSLNKIIEPLVTNPNVLSVPELVYFDNVGNITSDLLNSKEIDISTLPIGDLEKESTKMPFLMGLWRRHFVGIGGYDEDFTGYASDDNDFTDRMLGIGFFYYKTKAKVIHLYHGKVIDGQPMPDNPDWLYNYNLYINRKGISIRNAKRTWGTL